MFRPATRLIARPTVLRAAPHTAVAPRRCISTAPPTEKKRSWKSLVTRLGMAGAIIYYYNTTDILADEPRRPVHTLPEIQTETQQFQTLEAVAEERKRRKAEAEAKAAAAAAARAEAERAAKEAGEQESQSVEELQAEADQQGAFNPETGEINWDCPCLGGMAHGPCGEEFKAAFSCFVYSTEEPKGMDCIEKFKDMQNCFRQYPEIYGSEIDTDEDDEMAADATATSSPSPALESDSPKERAQRATEQVKQQHGDAEQHPTGTAPPDAGNKQQPTSTSAPQDTTDEVIPKAAYDSTAANASVEKK